MFTVQCCNYNLPVHIHIVFYDYQITDDSASINVHKIKPFGLSSAKLGHSHEEHPKDSRRPLEELSKESKSTHQWMLLGLLALGMIPYS